MSRQLSLILIAAACGTALIACTAERTADHIDQLAVCEVTVAAHAAHPAPAPDRAGPVAAYTATAPDLSVVALPSPTPPPPPPPSPTPSPSPTPPPHLTLACCTGASCVDHGYGTDVCSTLDEPVGATVLHDPTITGYDGSAPVVALYEGCDDDDIDHCGPDDDAYVFQLTGDQIDHLVAFDTATEIRIYDIDSSNPSGSFRSVQGDVLYPVVARTHPFAAVDRPVYRNGVLLGYLDQQDDCLARATGCGRTCTIC